MVYCFIIPFRFIIPSRLVDTDGTSTRSQKFQGFSRIIKSDTSQAFKPLKWFISRATSARPPRTWCAKTSVILGKQFAVEYETEDDSFEPTRFPNSVSFLSRDR